jgi:serine/threonine protein kinase
VEPEADPAPAPKLARVLASPTGVLVILPLMVIASGVVVMWLGRSATREASDSMAKHALKAQAADVQHDVAFALDQADPLMTALRPLANAAYPRDEFAIRLRDYVIGRPGIANVSIAFPSGLIRGTFLDDKTGQLEVQESIVTDHGTERVNLGFDDNGVHEINHETNTYDARTRPHYTKAVEAKTRVWLPPRTFFSSHKTGLTVTEPVYAEDGSLRAVTTVDFDVGALSSFIERPPFDQARTIVFAPDGTILAFAAVALPKLAAQQNRLLRHDDFADPALEALFAAIGPNGATLADQQRFFLLHSTDGDYLASVAPVGGKRAGIDAPIAWYLATLVPERVLLGPTHKLEKQSLFAAGGALAIAMGVALMFAWNLVRMRKAVGAAREAARSAEARARELGSYRLVERLGAGGMGEVWRAEHRLLARQAAIKLVRPEALQDPNHAPKIRERFRREAQTVATLRSRNTVELYDYGATDDGTFFYVMELLDGVDLDKLVRQHGALPAARVIYLLEQACHSLAEAHDAGLLHRDIKPANLVATRAADEVDVLKVVDFGIVQMIAEPTADPIENIALPPERIPLTGERLTQVGAVVGTPGYIAPESAFGDRTVDGRADLYALGCVAWWLLTASEVFPRDDEENAMIAHAREPAPALGPRMKAWFPAELELVVASLLAKRPQERPDDARALAKWLRSIEIPAEHAWTVERAQAWWREHRPAAEPGEPGAPKMPEGAEDVARVLVPQDDIKTVMPKSTGPDAPTVEQRMPR